MNQHYPFKKTIPSCVFLGTNPPNPAHTSKHSNFKRAAGVGEDSRIRPLFVNSPGTLLGCDASPIYHDPLGAELTWHLPCQYCPALVSSVMLLSELRAQVPTARPWFWKSWAVSPQITNQPKKSRTQDRSHSRTLHISVQLARVRNRQFLPLFTEKPFLFVH